MANITNLIANIRKAVYGKDVRESIASAIEQTYEDAAERGNANMEVVAARGTFDTLNQRLNNSDSEKADKAEVNTLIQTEGTARETADSNLQSQINGLASGSPAGVYETVAALTTADPDHSKIYVVTADGHWYYYKNDSWCDGGTYQASQNILSVYSNSTINANNYQSLLPDLNQAVENNVYLLLFAKNSTEIPANLPIQPRSNVEKLTVIKTPSYICQIYNTIDSIFYRYRYSNLTWESWHKIGNISYNELISEDNFQNIIPNLNSVSENGIYQLLFAHNAQNYPSNLPIPPSDNIEVLINIITKTSICQIYLTKDNMFHRYKYGNSWTSWNNLNPITVHVGATQKVKKIKDGVEFATQFQNSKVIIDEGTYDLIQEFGNEFFENYDSSSSMGMELKNNVHLIFSPNANIICNYNGNNTYVMSRFSPFNAGVYGYTLENCNLEAKRCRYCIHEERGGTNDFYNIKYKNCNLKNDDDNVNSYSGGQCIGGGLGHQGIVSIEGCTFESINHFSTNKPVSYHNNYSSSDTTAKSKVIIKDNYFKSGTIKCTWCGTSTNKSEFLISNNKLNENIIVQAERQEDTINNIEVLAFNNDIGA